MKQRTVVKSLIYENDKILLIRRQGGRPSIDGKYELPGGRIHIRQQPEDALIHALHIHLNVTPETMQLSDAMTFIDPDDRELQYLFLMYRTSLKPTDRTIKLSDDYDRYVWKKVSDIQREDLTQSTQQQLGMLEIAHASGRGADYIEQIDDIVTSENTILTVYTDGGSRGNPGPSASGFVIMNTEQQVISEGGAYLGHTTNNVAEYEAVYLALERAQELGGDQVDVRLDSQLVAHQMNGIYKIKNSDLLPIHNRIKEIAQTFRSVTYTHVRREHNKLADGVVNKILDIHTS